MTLLWTLEVFKVRYGQFKKVKQPPIPVLKWADGLLFLFFKQIPAFSWRRFSSPKVQRCSEVIIHWLSIWNVDEISDVYWSMGTKLLCNARWQWSSFCWTRSLMMEADVKQFLLHIILILNVLPIEALCPRTFCGKRLNKHWQRCNNVTMLHCILPRPLSFFVKDNRGRTCPNCCRVDNNADALLIHKNLSSGHFVGILSSFIQVQLFGKWCNSFSMYPQLVWLIVPVQLSKNT